MQGSELMKEMSKPGLAPGAIATVRNWNTVTKLAAMAAETADQRARAFADTTIVREPSAFPPEPDVWSVWFTGRMSVSALAARASAVVAAVCSTAGRRPLRAACAVVASAVAADTAAFAIICAAPRLRPVSPACCTWLTMSDDVAPAREVEAPVVVAS